MGKYFRPDILGFIDILGASMLYFTVSPLPDAFAEIHASFLLVKGLSGTIKPVRLPKPFFIIGGAADIISAAILVVGTPPILPDYKFVLAGILFLKGLWTLLGFMS